MLIQPQWSDILARGGDLDAHRWRKSVDGAADIEYWNAVHVQHVFWSGLLVQEAEVLPILRTG